jgi:hypothetical protein
MRCKHAVDREHLDTCFRWSGKHDAGVADFAPRGSGIRPRPHKHGPSSVIHRKPVDDDTETDTGGIVKPGELDVIAQAAENITAALQGPKGCPQCGSRVVNSDFACTGCQAPMHARCAEKVGDKDGNRICINCVSLRDANPQEEVTETVPVVEAQVAATVAATAAI